MPLKRPGPRGAAGEAGHGPVTIPDSPFPSWEIAQEWVHLANKNSIKSPKVHRFLWQGVTGTLYGDGDRIT